MYCCLRFCVILKNMVDTFFRRQTLEITAKSFLRKTLPPMSNQTGDSPIGLLSLPNELLSRIINITFYQGIPITPFICTCKEIYQTYRHLIYITKVAYVEEYIYLSQWKSRKKNRRNGFLDRMDSYPEICSFITVFNIHSHISTLMLQSKKGSQLQRFIPGNLQQFSKLLVLSVSLNSVNMMFNILRSLPLGLKVLELRLEVTKTQLSMIQLPKIMDNTVSYCPHLQYLEIVSHNYDLNLGRLHPELAPFLYSATTREEDQFAQVEARFRMRLLDKVRAVTNEYYVKKKLGGVLYQFLRVNCSSLLKIEILGIDLYLIFNTNFNQPASFIFDCLRLLSFDNTSRVNWSKWLPTFEQWNSHKTFDELQPHLICHDKMSKKLYCKLAGIHRPFARSEIEKWNWSEQVCLTYMQLVHELHLEF